MLNQQFLNLLASFTLILVTGAESARLSSRAPNHSSNSTFVSTAKDGIAAGLKASWEMGTAATALIEHDGSNFSPFSKNFLSGQPPMSVIRMAQSAVAAQDSLGRLSSKVTGDEETTGADAGSSLDSASNLPAVLVAAYWDKSLQNNRLNDGFFSTAAQNQFDYINKAPKASTGISAGAISHKAFGVQLWADSIWMGPPSIAFYGLLTRNKDVLQQAYDQIRLYRLTLQDPKSKLWSHIYNYDSQSFIDANKWSTGIGWVSGGIVRTLAAIAQSDSSETMSSQKSDLVNWSSELLSAVYPLQDNSTALFHNYVDQSDSFLDTAGSMLIAYSTFRLASMKSGIVDQWIPNAESIYQSVQSSMDVLGNFNQPTVDVLSFNAPGKSTSVEAFAFSVLLDAARRDYYSRNVTGLGNL